MPHIKQRKLSPGERSYNKRLKALTARRKHLDDNIGKKTGYSTYRPSRGSYGELVDWADDNV